MKLTREEKKKIKDRIIKSEYFVFGCYTDAVFSYYSNISDNERMEINIIPFDRLDSFLLDEELEDLLDRQFLFFDCSIFKEDGKREKLIFKNISSNRIN